MNRQHNKTKQMIRQIGTAVSPRRFVIMTAMTALLPCQSATAESNQAKLVVVDQIWGFDGRIQPGQFNPLSILLDNQTSDPIDATATLQRVQGFLNPTGGRYAQQVFIAPAGRRWIQFYPYVPDYHQASWRLQFDGKTIQELQQPRSAVKEYNDQKPPPPQAVILDKASRISTQPASVKHLPENVFPPYATATFGLHTVFLDHVPDWETPRQQAFLSWLKLGGRLHILRDSRNEYPQFSGELTDLNQPLDRYSIGNGIVQRHAIQRGELTKAMVDGAMVIDVRQGEDAELEEMIAKQRERGEFVVDQMDDTDPTQIDDTFFRDMRELTLPEHAWWLIFLLALCYIGLIFPGCFVLSRQRQLHFLTTYAAIAALSVLFSLLFLFIGRRGYGETTTLQTLAIARAEDATHWNVLEWDALFVTSGNNYTAGAAGQQSVYSTAETMNVADATILTGNQGEIEMRIPPFASQTFVCRRRIESADWKLKPIRIASQPSGLTVLTLETGDRFPAAEDAQYLALVGRRMYELKYKPKTGRLELFATRSRLSTFCYSSVMNTFALTPSPVRKRTPAEQLTEMEQFHKDSLPRLVRRSLLDELVFRPSQFELPPNRIRLFVYTDIPDDFAITASTEAKRTGKILFIKDVSSSVSPSEQ